jgi:addiction module HigA family antidote
LTLPERRWPIRKITINFIVKNGFVIASHRDKDTGFASPGKKGMRMKLKSSTTIRKRQAYSDLLPLVTPGEILAEEFMQPLGLSANALSLALRVPATRIQAIVKGERVITADTALRLGRYFGNSAEFWLNLQQHYELDLARREKLAEIEAQVTQRAPAA